MWPIPPIFQSVNCLLNHYYCLLILLLYLQPFSRKDTNPPAFLTYYLAIGTKAGYECGTDGIPITGRFCTTWVCKALQHPANRIVVKIEGCRSLNDLSDQDDIIVKTLRLSGT
jgi:hypothetical protein